jgi:diguanylate cyclase (GGDEF)-like protein
MLTNDLELINNCQSRLDSLLRGELPAPLHVPDCSSEEAQKLADTCNRLIAAQRDASTFLAALANGNLEIEPPPRNQLISPFKQLHASLRHLVWQTNQIAAGDLEQQIDFLGELSSSFNSMIDALRQKQSIEELLRYLSNHDPLTGLYNRLYFNEELSRLERGRQFPASFIVADINGLKLINDAHGHEAGDRMIVAAAEILRACVRTDDVAARLGGDEFSVILPFTRNDEAAEVLKRIRTQETLQQATNEAPLSISYGFATAETPAAIREALRIADRIMYDEKNGFYNRARAAQEPESGVTCPA